MHWVRTVVRIAAALAAIWLLSEYLKPLVRYTPWDFETYYFAAKAAGQGVDPYDAENLVALARRPVGMPFVYPPVTLPIFAPFTLLEVSIADLIWRGLCFASLAVLVWIWITRFLPRLDPLLLSIALAFGLNTAALWGLRVGNVAILEAVLLWTALACYIDGRRVVFTVLVVLASIFKILPIVFLALLLVPSKTSPARPLFAASGLVALGALVLVPIWLGPPWALGYFQHLPSIRPIGLTNPSALGFFDTILGSGRYEPAPLGQQLNPALALWAAYAVAIAACSLAPMRRSWIKSDLRTLTLESVTVFVLLSPRPMIYSYVMLVAPVFAFGRPALKHVGGDVLVFLLLIAPVVGNLFGFRTRTLFWDNYPFFLALAIWLMHVLPWRRALPHAAADADQRVKAGGRPGARQRKRVGAR
jgi:hypothetical protein